MWRVIKYLLIVGVIAGIFVWFADRPGSVSLTWQGYRIDTSASVLFAAVFLIALISAMLYRFWGVLVRTPGAIKRGLKDRRREKGYKALTQGMVAVAAGDAQEAQKHRRKAENLLDEPPLTMLLSAQAAQLAGDDRAAERFFTAMLENEETRFLGLRGLLVQATKKGDRVKAIALAEQAKQMKPDSAWINEHLFDLQTQDGRWSDALATLSYAKKRKMALTDADQRHLAALDVLSSEQAELSGNTTSALKLAKAAVKEDPTSAPAVLRLVDLHRSQNHVGKAAKALEQAWMQTSHPAYVAPYLAVKSPKDDLEAYKLIQRLVRNNKNQPESRMAIAEAALQAKLWGEARAALDALAADDTARTQRVCRLMAQLEEQENNDLASAKKWLMEAALAQPDPAWTCSNCGNAVESWAALCGNCGQFDTFEWVAPRHVQSLGVGPDTLPAPVIDEDATSIEALPKA